MEVDVRRVRVENRRDFGGPWLGLELIRQLGLKDFFEETIPQGREQIPWSVMALVLVLCRLCEPSSELFMVVNRRFKTRIESALQNQPGLWVHFRPNGYDWQASPALGVAVLRVRRDRSPFSSARCDSVGSGPVGAIAGFELDPVGAIAGFEVPELSSGGMDWCRSR
ncbi:MAG: hypothetical protein ACC645_08310 [Pirellulales bacterium]